MPKQSSPDKYQLVTEKLLTLMAKGVKPWRQSWGGIKPQNIITGEPYKGRLNPILCSVDMLIHEWDKPYFIGYDQAQQMGWQVRKGSKATWLRYGSVSKKEDKQTGEVTVRQMGGWTKAFNIAQCDDDGADTTIEQYLMRVELEQFPEQNPDARIISVDEFIAMQEAEFFYAGDRAFYLPSEDKIMMPPFEHFTSAPSFYATAIHELTHRTGHESRLNRDLSGKFGDAKYAKEELVAEMGAAFVCQELGIEYELENHADYLANWMSVIKEDNRAFFKAASLASKAADYLLEKAGLLKEKYPEPEEPELLAA